MRHHGGVTGACIHGFAPGTCLICQTLNSSKGIGDERGDRDDRGVGGKKRSSKQTSVAERPVPAVVEPAEHPARRTSDKAAGQQRGGPRVVPNEAPRTGSSLFKLTTVVIGVVVVIVLAWVALHLVFAVIRILELIGVALVALYVGWLAGVHHGHKDVGRKERGKKN